MAEGLSNSAIAARVFLTERGVEKHVTSIFQKLRLPVAVDTHRRVLAVPFSLSQGICAGHAKRHSRMPRQALDR